MKITNQKKYFFNLKKEKEKKKKKNAIEPQKASVEVEVTSYGE